METKKHANTALVYHPAKDAWGVTGNFSGQPLKFTGNFRFGRQKTDLLKAFISAIRGKKPRAYSKLETLDVYALFSINAKNAWQKAHILARRQKRHVSVEDIFLALLEQPSVEKLFKRMGVDAADTAKLLKNYQKLTAPQTGDAVKKVPFEAFILAVDLHNHKIGCLMVLGALLRVANEDNILQAIFSNIDLTLDKLKLLTVWDVNLNFEFPPGSPECLLLDCCQKASALEQHFGYFFELSAIEQAVYLSAKEKTPELRHKSALGLLVKAGLLAKKKRIKIITEDLVKKIPRS